ncbi:MAG: NAD+ synthase [Candidatus Freyarchaeota archaeon]|nr:NAD+ synthase [Candidatus Jordarchaeia archaeon]
MELGDLKLDFSLVKNHIASFIRGTVEKAGASGVVIGLSGGVDSSTVAFLLAYALGPERVLALTMPSSTTPSRDTEDAFTVAELLGIDVELVDIQPLEDVFARVCPRYDPGNILASGNLKPRLRMATLYYYANVMNRLVVGTGNKSEIMIGYFTKHGDSGVDMLPIGDLYKTQVRWLAEELGLPSRIIWKPPTAGLWPGQTDEGEIGVKYETLDLILYGLIELGYTQERVSEEAGIPIETVRKVATMVARSEHKRSLIPKPLLQSLKP